MARITTEQVENFALDADILALSTPLFRHIAPGGVAAKFHVSMTIAKRRLAAMQARGLVERMGNGQYKITLRQL